MNQPQTIEGKAPILKRANFRSLCDKCGKYIPAGNMIRITWNNPDSVTWVHAIETECT